MPKQTNDIRPASWTTNYQTVKHPDGSPVLPYACDYGSGVVTTTTALRAVRYQNYSVPVKQSRPKPNVPILALTNLGPYVRHDVHAMQYYYPSGIYLVYGFPRTFRETRTYYNYLHTGVPSPVSVSGNTEHLLKLRDLTADLSGGVAELDKAADGFLDVAKKVNHIAKRIRGKSRQKLSVCDVAATNLAVNFGIKTVVSDAYSIVEGVRRFNTEKIHRIASKASASRPSNPAGGEYWNTKTSVTTVSYVRLALNSTPYNIGNPVEWAWERTPFSFVVDWLYPIGDYIAASFATRGITHLGSYQTTRTTASLSSIPASGNAVIEQPSRGTYEQYQRTVLAGFPDPDDVKYDPTKSLTALGNAVSLLAVVNPKCKGKSRNPRRY